jgi:hypothetical protein
MRQLKLIIAALFLISPFAAQADPITADFRTESDLPDGCSSGPLVYENLGASIGAGPEMTGADFVQNPCNWRGGLVNLDWDASSNILTLDSRDTWDFQTFLATVTNIVFDAGEIIVGISMLTNGITDPTFAPTLSFTDYSVSILYAYTPGFFDFTGGTSTFQIDTLSVPEPGTLALFGIGLLGLGLARRSKKV